MFPRFGSAASASPARRSFKDYPPARPLWLGATPPAPRGHGRSAPAGRLALVGASVRTMGGVRQRALAKASLLAFLALLATPLASFAAETRPGEVITVGPNETINDDLYAFGRTVDVLGTVRGDVIAAGATITISGTVGGDVMAAGGQVRVTGDVNGSVRAGAGDVAIDGRVGEDVVVGSGNLAIGTRATVGRDIYAGSGSALINGRVGRK